jgi:hypothetical protein
MECRKTALSGEPRFVVAVTGMEFKKALPSSANNTNAFLEFGGKAHLKAAGSSTTLLCT